MRFPCTNMWRGNSDVVKCHVINTRKQLNDTKEQSLYLYCVLHILLIRRWRTRSDLAPRPCLDWHSGRSLELLRESSDHIITERCRPADWPNDDNQRGSFRGLNTAERRITYQAASQRNKYEWLLWIRWHFRQISVARRGLPHHGNCALVQILATFPFKVMASVCLLMKSRHVAFPQHFYAWQADKRLVCGVSGGDGYESWERLHIDQVNVWQM